MKNALAFFFFLVIYFYCPAQVCNYSKIDSSSNVKYSCKGLLQVNGKIDDSSIVQLTSISNDIIITGKIDGKSVVAITALNGSVTIRQNIGGAAEVHVRCRGNITIEGKIDEGANCDFYSETLKIVNDSSLIIQIREIKAMGGLGDEKKIGTINIAPGL